MQEKRLQSLDNISVHGFPLLCLRLLLSLPLAVVIKSQSQTTPHPSLSPLCFLSLGLLLFKSHPAASACLRFLDFFFFLQQFFHASYFFLYRYLLLFFQVTVLAPSPVLHRCLTFTVLMQSCLFFNMQVERRGFSKLALKIQKLCSIRITTSRLYASAHQ